MSKQQLIVRRKKYYSLGVTVLLRAMVFTTVVESLPVQAESSASVSLQSAPEVVNPLITGAATCSTSGCHGGAEEKKLQFVVWSQRDVHSRAYATLTTARSARMAEALGIPDATASTQCTTCHAPLQAVHTAQPQLLVAEARVTEGVSCVSCHGTGGDWVRSHTRPDFTHADRVHAGMKELRDLHARAGSCVACHQVIDPELVSKGRHPRLIFELDGQTASQPRHWRETAGYHGAQAWQVGQAVALREVSWSLLHGATAPEESQRWQALLWVLQRGEITPVTESTASSAREIPTEANNVSYARAREVADRLAREGAATFDPATVPARLKALAATHVEFTESTAVMRRAQAYRAERLVLALDRLLASLPESARPPAVSARLDAVFARAQSIPDFAPEAFARALKEFALALP